MSQINVASNFAVDFDAYVHFAYYVGKYLMRHCSNETCDERKVVNWYLDHFRGLLCQTQSSASKLQLVYGKLINNLIRDECLLIAEETSERRTIKKHPSFFVWAWRSQAKSHEYNMLNL
ncbi:hypothetical protein, conserved [Babesia bigemina]|uniref:Mcm6 C-terminal winged-helix domain-containing protein n=1 Tax=Babesia bigemina TaxID=5866 RepID=A0A061DC93_BABBI|nr:hypothetical protein, conserved [Babesia bigemina]CDR97667.1 hypothetical protein, conserved [Babesia bigemina]|eukprot:XP_012769853.1 hypothetical protein, conserved [Babesia bigemina]